MKRNDIVDLRSKTHDELRRMLEDLKSELLQIKKDQAMGKTKNTNAAKNKKKDVARVLTFLSMKKADSAGLDPVFVEPKEEVVANVSEKGKSREAGSRSAREGKK